MSPSSLALCVVLGPRGAGLEFETSLVALQGAAPFVVGAWTRHYGDPEYGLNAWMCVCDETVILRVVGRLTNPTLGCKDIKWSDASLVDSDIFVHSSV